MIKLLNNTLQQRPSVIPIVVTQSGAQLSPLVADAGRKLLGLEPVMVPFIHLNLASIESGKLAPLTCAAALVILGGIRGFDKKSRSQQEYIILEAISHLEKLKKHHEPLLKKLVYYIKCESPAMSKLLYGGPKLVDKNTDLKLVKKLKGGFKIMQQAKNLWFNEDQFINEGQNLGLVKGRAEERLETARRMLHAREPLSNICKFTGLSKTKVQKLK